MGNGTIDYESLVKDKYPDAILTTDIYEDVLLFWFKIKSINLYTSNECTKCNKKSAWEIIYKYLKQNKLI